MYLKTNLKVLHFLIKVLHVNLCVVIIFVLKFIAVFNFLNVFSLVERVNQFTKGRTFQNKVVISLLLKFQLGILSIIYKDKRHKR